MPAAGEYVRGWAMWLDADAIIMNPSVSLATILARAMEHVTHTRAANVHVVLFSDMHDQAVNSGVFFVCNFPQGRSFIASATAMCPLHKNSAMHEQETMTTLAFVGHTYINGQCVARPHPNIAIVPQRLSHSFGLDPDSDRGFPDTARWQSGDFVVHSADMPLVQRDRVVPAFLSQGQW